LGQENYSGNSNQSFEHLREESEESEESEEEPEPELSSEDMESNDNSQNEPQTTQSASLDSEHRKHIEIFLEELRNGQRPVEPSKTQDNASDAALNALNHKDFPALPCLSKTQYCFKGYKIGSHLSVMYHSHGRNSESLFGSQVIIYMA
jgi:hypothetical protein